MSGEEPRDRNECELAQLTCYQCDTPADKLSPRSRCVMCEYKRGNFNEQENETLRGALSRIGNRDKDCEGQCRPTARTALGLDK